MGISRDSRHKRRLTGGRKNIHQKKKKYEMGRPAANTKLGGKRIHLVRARGGNTKFRALRLDTGNFSWPSESVTRKVRILDVVYNASNNELVRTKTLVKGAIVQVDATAFRTYYEQKYGLQLGKKRAVTSKDDKEKAKDDKEKEKETPEVKRSEKALKKLAKKAEGKEVESTLKEQFNTGRLYAIISSRPGQSGRADGFIIEEKELDFYLKKMSKKK